MKASGLLDFIKSDMEKLSIDKSTIELKLHADKADRTSISFLMTKYNFDNYNEIFLSSSTGLNFEVDDEKLKDFQHRIDHYLDLYAPGDAALKQYIKGISLYLAFIARRPLHPPGLEFSSGSKVFEKDGLFYCSGKRVFIKEDRSLCKYCICRPA